MREMKAIGMKPNDCPDLCWRLCRSGREARLHTNVRPSHSTSHQGITLVQVPGLPARRRVLCTCICYRTVVTHRRTTCNQGPSLHNPHSSQARLYELHSQLRFIDPVQAETAQGIVNAVAAGQKEVSELEGLLQEHLRQREQSRSSEQQGRVDVKDELASHPEILEQR